MKRLIMVILALVVMGLLMAPLSAASEYDKYLTPAEVEKVSLYKGVKSIPPPATPPGGGELDFTTADGNMIVMVQFSSNYNYRGYEMYSLGLLKGLGEKALRGSTSKKEPANQVTFVKGNQCIALTAFVSLQGKVTLSEEQLIKLAKIIETRL